MTNPILDRYWKRFWNQENRDQRPIEVAANPRVDEICRRFEEYLGIKEYVRDKIYSTAIKAAPSHRSKTISEFSLRLRYYQEHPNFFKSSFFLSALIEKSEDNDFEIVLEHLDEKLEYIGYENRKNVRVIGDVGERLGCYMKAGSIIVAGDAGDSVGYHMKNGKVIISGSSGHDIGFGMEGDEIRIESDIGSISGYLKGGRIYHKGKLIRGKK